jgi:hypothetical protein
MTAMALIYFGLKYHLDSKDRYLIWFTQNPNADSIDDSDGVVIDENGAIPIFNSPIELTQYAKVNVYTPIEMENPQLHNLERVMHFICVSFPRRRESINENVHNLLLPRGKGMDSTCAGMTIGGQMCSHH